MERIWFVFFRWNCAEIKTSSDRCSNWNISNHYWHYLAIFYNKNQSYWIVFNSWFSLEYAQKQQETDGINQTIPINPSGKDKRIDL